MTSPHVPQELFFEQREQFRRGGYGLPPSTGFRDYDAGVAVVGQGAAVALQVF